MAKMAYLEVVELLGDDKKITATDKKKLNHIIARKKALKEEDKDLDGILDGLLHEIRGDAPDVGETYNG